MGSTHNDRHCARTLAAAGAALATLAAGLLVAGTADAATMLAQDIEL